jgi:hypothetical protein
MEKWCLLLTTLIFVDWMVWWRSHMVVLVAGAHVFLHNYLRWNIYHLSMSWQLRLRTILIFLVLIVLLFSVWCLFGNVYIEVQDIYSNHFVLESTVHLVWEVGHLVCMELFSILCCVHLRAIEVASIFIDWTSSMPTYGCCMYLVLRVYFYT